jgi:indole-3-glycerol phosphate synthase
VSLLADILANKHAEVDALRSRPRAPSSHRPIDVVAALRRKPAPPAPPARPGATARPIYAKAAHGRPLRLIAEVKLRSPSAGRLSRALAPDARALAYARSGAAMVSVLCDGPHFDGSWDHLAAARVRLDAARSPVPLMAKEFVVDARQIQHARDCGADAVLLIARIVDGATLASLARVAREEGLEPLVEVVDQAELAAALEAGARVVGVNARDLDSLAMDTARAATVLAAVPAEIVAVHFSGLRAPLDVAAVAQGRPDAALVGEALMRQDDPRGLLEAMVEAASR